MPLDSAEQIDGSRCPQVEVKLTAPSGAAVLRKTRMPVRAIVGNFACGLNVAEILEKFEIPQDRVQAILAYAKSHRVAHPVR
jgi:uncharacterized protein (DUF433 family)